MPILFAASPLRHVGFRLFYFGAIGTALGYTMQTTVAAWVMATLTPSEIMVAFVQTASTASHTCRGVMSVGVVICVLDQNCRTSPVRIRTFPA